MATLSKVREELAQTFLAALNQGQLPWHKCWSQALPVNAVTGKKYRGINTLVLSYYGDRRGYTDTRWCTYNQAQDKGWQVRKGEKGVRVEYWACYDSKEKKLLSWDDVRKKLKADPDYEKHLQLRCRTYTVFNAAQIDGIPEQERGPSTDIGALRDKRDTLIRNMGIGYEERGAQAYYSPSSDMVTLPPEATFDDTYSYMATFLHECGHATGHQDRLNRNLTGGFGSESYAREELRAEIASAFVSQELGLQMEQSAMEENLDLHKAYIQSWVSFLQEQPEELFAAIREADRISDYLIQAGEFHREQVLHLSSPMVWKTRNLELTLKNCYTRGGYSLSIRGSDFLAGLPGELDPYRRYISEVRIEEGITTLDRRALWKLPVLQYVSLPHSLERIGSWAFDYCPQLHTVEYCGSIAEWDALEKENCFLPEQFPNELERIDRPFALTAGEHCIIRAEEMAPEPTPQHSTEVDYELEME